MTGAVRAAEEGFVPFLPGAIVLLPLLGFLANGVLALLAARRAASVRVEGAEGEGGHGVAPAARRGGGAVAGQGVRGKPFTHRWPSWIGPGAVGLAFLVTVVNFVGMLGVELHEPVVVRYWDWITVGALQVDAALQLDPLSMIMALIVTGVSFLIHVYSVGYMGEDPGYPRYFAYLNLFVFFMLTLVLGSSFLVMFVGWEGVGLCSYLLIGFWFSDRAKADAGKKAFVVNRIGDFGFLIALFLIAVNFGTLDFVPVFERAPELLTYGSALATAIGLFLFLGAVGKSAQLPLYVWLPDAMAGPTPVSALIHAATMVTAGVYMVARASVIYALAPVASGTVAGVGVVTALFAASIGLAQYNIKRVLAYSTISQLGYMFLGVGVGAYAAGIFHLMTHAFFKALLFLCSGAVIHALQHAFQHTGKAWDPEDMRNMGGLGRYLPVTWVTMWVGALALAGVWPFAAFFSKDEIIWQTAARAVGPVRGLYAFYWVLALAAGILTAIYITRLMVLTFHGANRSGERERHHLHEAPRVMTVVLVALAVLSVLGGWVNVAEPIRESVFGLFGLLPMAEWLHHWLEPVTAAADAILRERLGAAAPSAPVGGGEVVWAFASTGVAALVIVATYRIVSGWKYLPALEAAEPRGFARVLYRKYYVDEIYDALVVRPVLVLSRTAWRSFDDLLIDRTVNGLGVVARGLGWLGSRLQTGQVNTYALVLALGVLLILGAVLRG